MIPEVILVQLHSGGRIKFIILTCNHDTVHREWGLVGGKTQTTSNTYDYINKGKANELAPWQAADADFHRIIETKKKEGYVQVDSLSEIPELADPEMDFNDLPVQFCCSKPYTSIKKAKLNKMASEDKARYFIKENGLCHFVLITPMNDVKIYTRRIDDHTAKYPKLVSAFKEINLPGQTLIAIELIVGETENFNTHMSRFKRVSSVSRSDTLKGKVKDDITKTLALQEETPVYAVMFNLLYIEGKACLDKPYDTTIDVLHDIQSFDTSGYILTPTEMSFEDYDACMEFAKDNIDLYEGLVVWNKEENAEITYNGKPNRRACYKLKAVREDDVIAYDWLEGSGAKQGKVGSLLIGKFSRDLEEIIPMGKVGSGLKIKQGECELSYWDFPCVIEIEYDQRFDTGNYQFPRFIKKHEDKLPKDVVVDEDGF